MTWELELPATRFGKKPPRPNSQQPEFEKTALFSVSLTDTLVSLDAGHANHETARTIVTAGGDYLIQLKGNAPAVQAAAAHAVKGVAPPFFDRRL